MKNVLVIGAGSIGNHLSHACRERGWSVDLYDIDPEALTRTRDTIYPTRYGKWDEEIHLLYSADFASHYDLAIIGTPPDTHLSVAIQLLETLEVTCILLEKPLCSPSLEGLGYLQSELSRTDSRAVVGYNHIFTANTTRAEAVIRENDFGPPVSLHVRWLEHWGGIFGAHPWLSGPQDTYLGDWSKGGGACGEHSHAISLWQHFSNLIGMGWIDTVSCLMKIIEGERLKYDETAVLQVTSKNGLIGSIIQDVVTAPAEKSMRIQFRNGFLEWKANIDSSHDAIEFQVGNSEPTIEKFKRLRPDDFVGQMNHIDAILSRPDLATTSPNRLEEGIWVMKVISAAHRSHIESRTVQVEEIENPW